MEVLLPELEPEEELLLPELLPEEEPELLPEEEPELLPEEELSELLRLDLDSSQSSLAPAAFALETCSLT